MKNKYFEVEGKYVFSKELYLSFEENATNKYIPWIEECDEKEFSLLWAGYGVIRIGNQEFGILPEWCYRI